MFAERLNSHMLLSRTEPNIRRLPNFGLSLFGTYCMYLYIKFICHCHCHCTGASTQGGEWCEMHHGENWGENVVMIMMLLLVSYNNLLLHEYIYYFTPVHL